MNFGINFVYLLEYFSIMHPKIAKFCNPKSIYDFSTTLIKNDNTNKSYYDTSMMKNQIHIVNFVVNTRN